MNIQHLKKIISDYEAGNSSLHDEEALHRFFSGETVPPGLMHYKAIFNAREQLRQQRAPGADARYAVRKAAGMVKSGSKTMKLRRFWYAAAAGIVLILTAIIIQFPSSQENLANASDSFKEPEAAYQETRKALFLLSENLNLGLDKARKSEVFNQGIARVGMLNLFENIENEPSENQ